MGPIPNRRWRTLLVATLTLSLLQVGPAGAIESGFSDVPTGHVFATPITWLAATGITQGCNPPADTRFCPDANVTRGQMAAFLVRALNLPGSGAGRFVDVAGSAFENDINRLAAAGITRGCNPPADTLFCPDANVTRGQMAAFLWRAFDRPAPLTGALLVAAGDIAECGAKYDEATAAILDLQFSVRDGVVAALGDTVYPDGSTRQYADCYQPSWGRHKDRTRPAAGNHEYRTSGAAGYFGYFGSAAGTPTEGWYAYDHGGWRIIVLNSNCSEIGGCGPGSRQLTWLKSELAANPKQCTLAYMHFPRFSSGSHGDVPKVKDLWQALYDAGADVVLAGHDHDYERLAPMRADGTLDYAKGIRSFVVGTGGTWLRSIDRKRANSEVALDRYHGVLSMTLGDGVYGWDFIDTTGVVRDSGVDACH